MKRFFVLLAIAACGKAAKNARAIDPGAVCVQRKDDLALCEMRDGRLFVCDDERCIFVGDATWRPPMCAPAAAAFPVLEAPTGSKGDQ